MATETTNQDPINDNNLDFLDTPAGAQLATEYQKKFANKNGDLLFLVCLFFALKI